MASISPPPPTPESTAAANGTTATPARRGSLATMTAWFMQRRRWVILAMLLSLHLALITPAESLFLRVWLLVHFGLFLIWQPFVSADRELNFVSLAILVAITIVTLVFLAGWMLVAWVAILIAIMGGKVFTMQAARQSRFYLVAVFYLFAILLVWAVPVFFLGLKTLPAGLHPLAALTLPFVLAAMLFLPLETKEEATTQVFDFFYSLFVFQLVVVIVLGSLAAMRVTDQQYFPAVLLTVLAFAGALLVLAIIWGPRAGFGGLRTYFSRYLMTVGMPFELWMRRIAALSEEHNSSAQFLQLAMDEIGKMPWVVGVQWQSPDGAGQLGRESVEHATFQYHDLSVTFHTEVALSPALALHVRLLAQVIGEFYEGKRREQLMKESAYMQAVHETGARLTHDVKNLLQSLYAITNASVVARERKRSLGTDSEDARASDAQFDVMLERQLPQLSKRLQTTLDKLRIPAIASVYAMVPAMQWWREATQRNANIGAVFEADANVAGALPANIFDSVLENCLENARHKRDREPGIEIRVALTMRQHPMLTITDTGSAIEKNVAAQMFRAPVASSVSGLKLAQSDPVVEQSGMGIGLFQAARQAADAGYVLSLAQNHSGCVQFTLTKRLM
jgi:hypothetical protein